MISSRILSTCAFLFYIWSEIQAKFCPDSPTVDLFCAKFWSGRFWFFLRWFVFPFRCIVFLTYGLHSHFESGGASYVWGEACPVSSASRILTSIEFCRVQVFSEPGRSWISVFSMVRMANDGTSLPKILIWKFSVLARFSIPFFTLLSGILYD